MSTERFRVNSMPSSSFHIFIDRSLWEMRMTVDVTCLSGMQMWLCLSLYCLHNTQADWWECLLYWWEKDDEGCRCFVVRGASCCHSKGWKETEFWLLLPVALFSPCKEMKESDRFLVSFSLPNECFPWEKEGREMKGHFSCSKTSEISFGPLSFVLLLRREDWTANERLMNLSHREILRRERKKPLFRRLHFSPLSPQDRIH